MNTASFFPECFLIRDYFWNKKTIKWNIATLLLMKSGKETKVSRYFPQKKKMSKMYSKCECGPNAEMRIRKKKRAHLAISLTSETSAAFPIILQKCIWRTGICSLCVCDWPKIDSFIHNVIASLRRWIQLNTCVCNSVFFSLLVLVFVWFLLTFLSWILLNLKTRAYFHKSLKGHLYAQQCV